MREIKGLIFDLDGTLTLTQQFHYQAFAQVFREQGIDYTAEEDQLKYSGKGSHCIFPEVFASHGITLKDEQIEEYSQKKRAIYDNILQTSEIQIVRGAKEFLMRMRERGLRMLVASGNQPDLIDIILQRAGLDTFFEMVLANRYVKHSKPDPEIFLTAAHRLECLPAECVIFEDAINGIEAAKAAGIKSVGITTGTSRADLLAAGASAVVTDFTEVTDEMLMSL